MLIYILTAKKRYFLIVPQLGRMVEWISVCVSDCVNFMNLLLDHIFTLNRIINSNPHTQTQTGPDQTRRLLFDEAENCAQQPQ